MRQKLITRLAFVLGFLAFAVPAAAQSRAQCSQHFAEGKPPAIENARLNRSTRPLCYAAFSVLHSGVTRGPLWSAQHLTRDSLKEAACVDRVNAFRADHNLPEDQRAELADYAGSGFDRGHMAPAGDMPTLKAQDESFSLANMTPQRPQLNRRLWERIEATTQRLTMDKGELYVVTGAVFQGSNLQALKGRVLVPTHLYKAIYSPSTNEAAAYWATNTTRPRLQRLSLAQLKERVGVDVFPGVATSVSRLALPQPKSGGRPTCEP